MMRVVVFVVLLAIMPLYAAPQQDATKASQAWLKLLDAGQYGKAYDTSSGLMKKALPKARFEAQMKRVLGALGKNKGRTLRSADFKKQLPGAPAGEYYIVLFDSKFDKRAKAIETVVPTKEKDGKWRVSGFFIR